MGKWREDAQGGKTMKCGICKAETEEKRVTYTEDLRDGVVVIRHVPAWVCTECGNIWYSGSVAARLEEIVNSLANAVYTEVAIVNFTGHAA
jgi:YgiT-type zinc finger domain-containing protein